MYSAVETLTKVLRNYHQHKVLFTFVEHIYSTVFNNMLLLQLQLDLRQLGWSLEASGKFKPILLRLPPVPGARFRYAFSDDLMTYIKAR